VAPNPLVGCVIVHQGRIIGEGFHRQYGQAHAEVNAVAAVSNTSLLPDSTAYVTLEPCAHFGKTPPCADMLIERGLARVVVATADPNPLVGGQGIQRLREAGVDVTVGICEAEARWQNRRFFTFLQKKRPYILLKWAQTADGFMAPANYQSLAISNALAKRHVHQWRSQEAAIGVGFRTALYDNPQLNVRHWTGPAPLRLVWDTELRLPADLHLWQGPQATLVLNAHRSQADETLSYQQVALDPTTGQLDLDAILVNLYQRGVQSVLVEGGAALLTSFLEKNYWDEARILHAPWGLSEGLAGPTLQNGIKIAEEKIADNRLEIWENTSAQSFVLTT
jgi:diaminohydroxyphosphoribosylaminopyrimidine deaminase/5-amino-6-(5-phosphoribosylamino)uracil reductase